ncbi:hypothetical protein V6N13_129389 [Hibiscus sabdariffa]
MALTGASLWGDSLRAIAISFSFLLVSADSCSYIIRTRRRPRSREIKAAKSPMVCLEYGILMKVLEFLVDMQIDWREMVVGDVHALQIFQLG